MADQALNLYASKLFGEHPIAIWPLDSVDEFEESPQYSSTTDPAIVSKGEKYGLPLVYGSQKSIAISPGQSGNIIVTQDRTWERVKVHSDSGRSVDWDYWESETYDTLRYEDILVIDLGEAAVKHPSYGMYSNDGKYNSYTAEFWIRIDPRVQIARKIWGTLYTLDGIWVNDSYITLVIGNQHQSYAIENWYRPMIVNVTYTPEQSRMLINGQEVASIYHDPTTLDFSAIAEEYDDKQGWLGFSSYPNIDTYEIDAVSLFPYVVPDDVCKRRFVWGQGVSNGLNFSSFFQTTSVYFDYSFADYSTNIIYPDLNNWDQGYMDGLITTRSSLKSPSYNLPEIYAKGRNLDNLYLENQFNNTNVDEPGFSFRPEFDYDQPSYFYFSGVETLTSPVQSIYGVFEKQWYEDSIEPQCLMLFQKRYSSDEFRIVIEGNQVTYYYNETVKKTFSVKDNEMFNVGVDLSALVKSDVDMKLFFLDTSTVELYVGGDGVQTFSGLIYRVGFSDSSNMARNETAEKYTDGYANEADNFIYDYATYTLRPFVRYGRFYLDVASSGYWEDSIPLSFLGKNIVLEDGTTRGELDFFQINMGYDGDFTIVNDYYDFSGSEMNAYVTFQPLNSQVDKPLREFVNTQKLSINKIHDVSSLTPAELLDTKFSITDGCVIIPPPAYDKWKVVVYFVVNAEGIIGSPFAMKSLEFASQANENEVEVGTRFGVPVYSENKFALYKENNPYLYLTKNSGIEPLDGPCYVNINENASYPYPVGSINLFVKPTPQLDKENALFYIQAKSGRFDFVYNGTGWTIQKDGLPVEYLSLYQDGELVTEITLEDERWVMIGIEAGEPFDFDAYRYGKMVFDVGAVYQNISISALASTQVESTAIIRTWGDLKIQNWIDWENDVSIPTYQDLISSRSYIQYPVGPDQIFRIFTGSNSALVGTDDLSTEIIGDRWTLWTGVEWNAYSLVSS